MDKGFRAMTQEDHAKWIIASLALDPALTQKCLDVLADIQRKRAKERKGKAA